MRKACLLAGPCSKRGAETMRDAISLHGAHRFEQRGFAAGKDLSVAVLHAGEYCKRGRAQRNTVLAVGLHAGGRNNPRLCLEIDLGPPGADYLARTANRMG